MKSQTFIGYSFRGDVIGKPAKGDPQLKTLDKSWEVMDSNAALNHLQHCVNNGLAVAPGIYTDGVKTKGNFVKGQLVLLDYDGTMNWELAKENPFFKQHCIGAFTTASHRNEPGQNRFRVMGILPTTCESAHEYDDRLRGLREYLLNSGFGEDDSSMQSAQCSFGNPDAEVIWWNQDNRLPDIAPLERKPQERKIIESDSTLETKKAKAMLCLQHIPPRGPDGTNTYPDAIDTLKVLINELGPDEAYNLIDDCDWHGEWDTAYKIESLIGNQPEEEHQLRMGSLIAMARHHAGDELEEFNQHLTNICREELETIEVDVGDLFGQTTGYKVGDTIERVIKPGLTVDDESGTVWVVDKRGKSHNITYAKGATLMVKDVIPTLEAVTNEHEYRYNTATMGVMCDGVEMSGEELDNIQYALSREYGINFPKDTKGALTIIAMENSYDPYEDELKRFEDTVEPIDISNLATRYFHSTTPLADVMLEKWLVGLVGRLLEPGLPLRGALVVVGKQYIGKDGFINTLVNGDGRIFSVGSKSNLKDVNFMLACSTAWIANLDEIERVTRHQLEGELKSWLTQTEDRFTVKYKMYSKTFPRRFSIYGSCNHPQFLQDPTGNTRYWVIESPLDWEKKGERVDLKLLAEERDAILAGAIAKFRLFQQGEYQIELDHSESMASEQFNKGFVEDAAYVDQLSMFLDDRTTTCMTEIEDFLGLDVKTKSDKRLTNQVNLSLEQLGWTKLKSPRKMRKDGYKGFSLKVLVKDPDSVKVEEMESFFMRFGQRWSKKDTDF